MYRFAAFLIVHLLPSWRWYPAAFLIARVQIKIIRPLVLLGLYPYRRDISAWEMRNKIVMARLMDGWLKHLAASRRPFPIPIRTRGIAEVRELLRTGTSLVFCSVHCLLAEPALRALLETGVPGLTLITREEHLAQGCLVCGTEQVIPTIYADDRVLLKTRGVLRRGGSIVALIDRSVGAPLEANMPRLACMVGARIVVSIPELQRNGEILLDYFVTPVMSSERAVQLTLEKLEAERNRILQIGSSGAGATNQKTPGRLQPFSAARERESAL